MIDSCRRLWRKKRDPHTALLQARGAAREKGVPFGDWASWVVTGKQAGCRSIARHRLNSICTASLAPWKVGENGRCTTNAWWNTVPARVQAPGETYLSMNSHRGIEFALRAGYPMTPVRQGGLKAGVVSERNANRVHQRRRCSATRPTEHKVTPSRAQRSCIEFQSLHTPVTQRQRPGFLPTTGADRESCSPSSILGTAWTDSRSSGCRRRMVSGVTMFAMLTVRTRRWQERSANFV